MCVHIGGDEILLDDPRRLVEAAVASGIDAKLDIRQRVLEVFPKRDRRVLRSGCLTPTIIAR
jgi:hypothetical protein